MAIRRITVVLILLTLCLKGTFAYAQITRVTHVNGIEPVSLSQVYSQASKGNVKALRYAVARGLDIDATDKNGNTGLCHAILQKNYTAYNTYRAAGAAPQHPCISRIPTKEYNAFIRSNKATPVKTVSKEVYKGFNDKESFITGKSLFWGGLGVAAIAGGVWLLTDDGDKKKKNVPVITNPTTPPVTPPNPGDDDPPPEDEDPIYTRKEAGRLVGTEKPEVTDEFYKEPTLQLVDDGSSLTNTNEISLNNNSEVFVLGEDGKNTETIAPLTEVIDFNKSVTDYAKYMSVAMKAENGSVVNYGVTGNSADNKYMNLGNNTVGMVALGNEEADSRAYNYDQINLRGQNGIIGMMSSSTNDTNSNHRGWIYNYDRILISMVSSEDTAIDGNTKNQIIGMYADNGSYALNQGIIDGINNINGTIVGMAARIVNEETDPSVLLKNWLVNGLNYSINLGLTADGVARQSTAIGMGSFSDPEFLNGTKRWVRAIGTDINNNGNIYLTLNVNNGGSWRGDVTTGQQGLIGVLAGANTTAQNNSSANIRIYTVGNESINGGMAGMLAMHGGTITNKGYINIEGGRGGYGMLGIRGPGTNSEINFLSPTLINERRITIDSINGIGMASLFGGHYIDTSKGTTQVCVDSDNDPDTPCINQNFTIYNNTDSDGNYIDAGDVVNEKSSPINIMKGGIGMKMVGRGTATNQGNIYIHDTASVASTGMWAEAGGWIINDRTGYITIYERAESQQNYIGLYATGVGSKIINKGNITLARASVGGENDGMNDENYETECSSLTSCNLFFKVENGATFENLGVLSVPNSALRFNAMADDSSRVILGEGGSFEAPEISGKIYLGSDIVGVGSEETYLFKSAFIGKNTGINALSQSVFFNASVEDNEDETTDAVLTKKDVGNVVVEAFDAAPQSASIAEFIETNNTLGLGGDLMINLMKSEDYASLNNLIAEEFGVETIPNFAKQNMDVIKSLDNQINDSLFRTTPEQQDRVMVGYDYTNRDQKGKNILTGYEDKSHSIYALFDTEKSGSFRYGIGAGLTKYSSDYDNNDSRKETIVQLFAPLSYSFKDFTLVSVPRIGYGFGDYTRKTQNAHHSADTKNYYYGITNEIRKPFDLKMFVLEPSMEFNILGLYQKSASENGGGLKLDDVNNLSIEAGIGLYARKEFKLSDVDVLKLRLGGTFYQEFNDPYDDIEASFNNMTGSFKMSGYDSSSSRGVLSARMDYQRKMLNFYIQLNKYLESQNALSFNAGIGYEF